MIYVYKCPTCEKEKEVIGAKLSDKPPKCRKCKIAMEKQLTTAMFRFRISGR